MTRARLSVVLVVSACASLAACAAPQASVRSAAGPAAGSIAADEASPAASSIAVAVVAPKPDAPSRPKMDLVFALDTTGSMGAMLEGAKAKIWEIARRAQEGKPAPELRVGLVAYRDVGDQYVTKVVPLTSDLDTIYANLTDLHAAGGGDTPEHVLKGLNDAITEMAWTDSTNAVKLLYLVGDAPPHFDYHDGITLEGVLRGAAQRSIRISAIRCGNDAETLAAFTKIALPSDGEVATIEQSGGVVVAAATPYDEKLARLNAELAATEVPFGSDDERAEAARVMKKNLDAPAVTQAERAAFYGARAAGAVRGATKKDLVANPSALAAVKDVDLPEALRKLSPAERARFIEEQRVKRAAILARVQATKAARDAQAARSPAPAPRSAFDTKVFSAMKKAADGVVGY
jgi:Mg-chelatase subunit ChlD